jgi:hypothetical protein
LVVYMDGETPNQMGEVRTGARMVYFLTQGGGSVPFKEVTAAQPDAATVGNFAVFKGLKGEVVSFEVVSKGAPNMGLQGFQIVEEQP